MLRYIFLTLGYLNVSMAYANTLFYLQSTALDVLSLNFFRCPPFSSPLPTSLQPHTPSLRPSPHCGMCPWAMHILIYSLTNLFTSFHLTLSTPLLWHPSICSTYSCLWFYLVHQCILFIRFHIFSQEGNDKGSHIWGQLNSEQFLHSSTSNAWLCLLGGSDGSLKA